MHLRSTCAFTIDSLCLQLSFTERTDDIYEFICPTKIFANELITCKINIQSIYGMTDTDTRAAGPGTTLAAKPHSLHTAHMTEPDLLSVNYCSFVASFSTLLGVFLRFCIITFKKVIYHFRIYLLKNQFIKIHFHCNHVQIEL